YGDIPAKEMKKVLDDLGIKAVSSHVGLPFSHPEQLMPMLAWQIAYNQEIGSEYLVVPMAPFDKLTKLSDAMSVIQMIRQAAEECKRQGIGFAYHNHALEFEKIEEKMIHELIFEEIGPELLQ